MAKAEGIPPTASVASTGLGIRYIGDWAYGYSGVVGADTANTLVMEFTTGTGFIDMRLVVMNSSGSGDDFVYSIYLNDVISLQWYALGVQDPLAGKNPIPLLLPPFTKFTLRADNQGSGTKRDHTANFVGRVYDA